MPETSALESSCSGILTFINLFDAPNFKFHFPTNSAKHLQTNPFIHLCRFDTTSGLPKIQRSIAFEKVWASLVCSQKLQIINLDKQTQHPPPPPKTPNKNQAHSHMSNYKTLHLQTPVRLIESVKGHGSGDQCPVFFKVR